MRLALALPLLLVALASIPLESERVRKLSLKRRLVRYYQIHAPNSPPSERKLAKLLSKYGRDAEHELEEALRAKYGSGTLPAEDYRQLFARELIGPSIYLLSSRAASWRDGWIAPAHLSALHSAWAECRPSEKLLLLAVLWAFAASLSSSLARPLVTLTFLLAICQLVAPQPSTLAPSSLVADAHHSWLRAEGGERVGLLSAAHLIAYALLGPAHLTPCIFAWLGSALVATSPTPPQAYEGMAFVHPSARGAVRAAAQPGTGLKLSTLELGPISFVVLQVGEGESMWQASVMAAGAIERWVPLTTMRLEGKNKISLDGLVLPVAAVYFVIAAILTFVMTMNGSGQVGCVLEGSHYNKIFAKVVHTLTAHDKNVMKV